MEGLLCNTGSHECECVWWGVWVCVRISYCFFFFFLMKETEWGIQAVELEVFDVPDVLFFTILLTIPVVWEEAPGEEG